MDNTGSNFVRFIYCTLHRKIVLHYLLDLQLYQPFTGFTCFRMFTFAYRFRCFVAKTVRKRQYFFFSKKRQAAGGSAVSQLNKIVIMIEVMIVGLLLGGSSKEIVGNSSQL